MVTVPLGLSAYRRDTAGAPEIRLENRYLEKMPTNLREHVAVIGRPGYAQLVAAAGGGNRGCFFKSGLFNSDLFVVQGSTLYRINAAGVATAVTGIVAGTGWVYMTWMKGIGYELLWVSDGASLQYYTAHAMGTLTLAEGAAPPYITNQVIQIGTVYYGWGTNLSTGTDDGTLAHPYLALKDPSGIDANSLQNMVDLLNFAGNGPGLSYSSTLTGPSATVTATKPSDTKITLTAIANDATGDITSLVTSGSFLTWSGATLTGGGGNALQSTAMGVAGEAPLALANQSSYVLVGVANSQKFEWINPGEVTIDPLNFAEKESNPDNILDMLSIGDQVVIAGAESTENWYATGNFNAPFAPQEGRVYARGVIQGTLTAVNDDTVLVGNDGVVYAIGYKFGTTAQWGVHRISDNAVEERIRIQLNLEDGRYG